VALVLGALWFLGVSPLLSGSASQAQSGVTPPAATGTLELPSSIAAAGPVNVTPAIHLVTAAVSTPRAILSTVVIDQSTPTIQLAATRVDACGHDLDEEFGIGRKFIVHRVQAGESLDTYATTYGTDLATIQGINARPLNPLLAGQIIVIPVHQKSIDGVPLFDVYQLAERTTKYAKITVLLGLPDLNDFLIYNGFQTKCPYFSGWVLAPRSRPATQQPELVCFSSDGQSAVICYPTATPTRRVREP
jgi:hypothetical protein